MELIRDAESQAPPQAPHAEWEPAFQEDPQVIHMHTWEAPLYSNAILNIVDRFLETVILVKCHMMKLILPQAN